MSWVNKFRDNRKSVLIALVIFACLMLLDFYNRVYVSVDDSQRDLTSFSYVMPYQQSDLALPDSLNTWMKATDKVAQEEAKSAKDETIKDILGAEKLGEYDVRINAVFIGRDRFALAEVKKEDGASQRKSLRLGDVIGQFKIITIEAEKITLLNEVTGEDKELAVFKKEQKSSSRGVN